MQKALCLYQTPWGVSYSVILHHDSVRSCHLRSLSVFLCECNVCSFKVHSENLRVGDVKNNMGPG